ncbi:MAG TPA: cysteine peptidase family C39 domain-containing protein [Anaerohalosphaeraceae bacterium]|nr:cysteine peptidase family C39 domain-containing protein [Anaerohalosphaeraceae bacterium]
MSRKKYQFAGAETFMRSTIIGCLILCAAAAWSSAGRIWTSAETETLLRTLTDSPRRYWIESGRIRAKHLNYRQAEDWLAQTEEIIIFDGQRFRWEITLDGDEQAVPEPMKPGQKTLRVPDKASNRNRIFVWDGNQYIRYYPNTEYAVISEQAASSAPVLRGPLTAEIVPWGHGDYALSALLSRQPIVQEETLNGRTVLRLSFTHQTITPPLQCVLLLDPAMNYAVLSLTLNSEAVHITTTYSDYSLTGGRWIPRTIRTERYARTAQGLDLISYDDWVFTEINTDTPAEDALKPHFKEGTLVEVHPGGGRESLLYHSREQTNISELMTEKMSLPSGLDESRQNCAQAAVQLLKRRFATSVLPSSGPAAAAASSAAEPMTGLVSLYEVKQKLEQAGLYCLAVQTDIQTLQGLSDCGIIVHLPNQKHYLIVDKIDGGSVWTIDLSSRKFYWKWRIADFVRDWKEGTALLVADSPTRLPTQIKTLEPTRLYEIVGGDGELYETYSCTQKIQEDDWIPCPMPIGGTLCYGLLYVFYPRYGCVEDENGGFCEGRPMDGMDVTPCLTDPLEYGSCVITSEWHTTYIRACK